MKLWKKTKAKMDFEKDTVTMKFNGETIEFPVYCNNEENISSSEEDSDYDENEEHELYSSESESEDEDELEQNAQFIDAYLITQTKEQTKEKDQNRSFEKDLKIGKLDPEDIPKVKNLIVQYKEICIVEGSKLGKTNIIKHRIDTQDHPPIKQRYYRETPEKKETISKEIKDMLDQGVIRPSYSPWASPVVIVKKKDGRNRFCIDYRKINSITVTDAFPMPRIDDLLEKFETAKWFSSMDLASGYWQIAMDEKDIPKTAFATSQGLYEFVVMPFGLTNAPATFQRLMNHIFKEYIGKFLVVYIDDILIYSKTFEEHLEHLYLIFERLKEVDLMIKLKKCEFCKSELTFLGHLIGKDGIKPDESKIRKIKEMKTPQNLGELRSALGLFSYYRKFVKDYAKIEKPLNELKKKDVKYEWSDKRQQAFETLKQKLMEQPILQHPDYEKPFLLITDASEKGLGVILSQLDENNKEVVIAYGGRSLKPAEKNYPITDQECLAVMYGIKQFHKYLIGKPFTIITDHSALKSLSTLTVIPKGRRGRWMMELQQYNFKIEHRAGKENRNADALSRMTYK
jgi:hypothetical protein